MLGVAAAEGRILEPEDDRQPGAHPVAVVSDRFWRRRLARAPDVVGRKLTFNETAYTIVGVAPASFMGDWIGHPTDVWVPIASEGTHTLASMSTSLLGTSGRPSLF
jgi:hypothetical protein